MMTNPQGFSPSKTKSQADGPTLTIMQGKTQFPSRPISKSRFLIGAGNICDLQLGDPHIPLLHTIILFQNGELTCESLVSQPALMLNGKLIRDAVLNDGDILKLGKYSFQVELPTTSRLPDSIPESLADMNCAPHILNDIADDLWNLPSSARKQALAEMSAADLIDLMESEFNQLEEIEEIKLAGLDAMISEALELHARESRLPLDSHLPQITAHKNTAPSNYHENDLHSLINLIAAISKQYAGKEHSIPQSVREELIEAQEQLQLLIYLMDQQRRSA